MMLGWEFIKLVKSYMNLRWLVVHSLSLYVFKGLFLVFLKPSMNKMRSGIYDVKHLK